MAEDQNENSLEENTLFANDIIGPIMDIINVNMDQFDLDKLRGTLKKMNDHVGTIKAFPFQETMDKADIMRIQNDIFEKIIELIELRIKQRAVVFDQIKPTAGDQILRHLGM